MKLAEHQSAFSRRISVRKIPDAQLSRLCRCLHPGLRRRFATGVPLVQPCLCPVVRPVLQPACQYLVPSRFGLYEVEAEHMPRNWPRWAAQTVQTDLKVTHGNPRDVQHASRLPDCDLSLTADENFLRMLDQIAEQAPVSVGRDRRVAHPAHDGNVEAIQPALHTL
ncbi:hypothetical protein [Streptomyces sp. NBC_00134]|uniref:hypothetical protein n=1 Tax=Streptomyces sp. NBC_00134 TaxID=2975663 RepID=UPI003254FF3C